MAEKFTVKCRLCGEKYETTKEEYWEEDGCPECQRGGLKQCGTCRFASEFCYASSPSGPTDGVHCVSRAHAELLDEQTGGDAGAVAEMELNGFLDLWRLELMAEKEYVCPNWEPRG